MYPTKINFRGREILHEPNEHAIKRKILSLAYVLIFILFFVACIMMNH